MNFAQPYWLLAGLAACLLLLWRYRRFNRRQRNALAQFVSAHLIDKLTPSVSASRRRLKQALFIAGVACLFVALAQPRAGFRWQEVHRKGVELLVAVDTSKSMLAEDVKPNRLGRAKLAVNDLIDNLNGDGVGLLAFAGDAFLQCPITLDYDAFRESLNSLDTNTIPRGGTDIGGAIREAQAVLDARPGAQKILILITDGEDLGGDAAAAAHAAAKDGMKIFTVGVGTGAGELIPVPDADGATQFVKDSAGQFVKSRLDESTLKLIAVSTGGMYEPLGQQGQGLAEIYHRGLAPFTRHDLASRRTKVFIQRFQWPLLAAIFCFVGEMSTGTRKRRARIAPAGVDPSFASTGEKAGNWSFVRTASAAAALALVMLPATSQASPTGAEKAYQKGDYSLAEKEYTASLEKQPKQSELQFNLGSASYKSGDYAKAMAAFQDSLHTTDVPVQQSAYYNLGNTQYRIGQETERNNPQTTIKSWEQAVKSYEAALQIKPDDVDAKFNRDLVEKKLEQLQQKQNEQSKDQKQDQQNKNQQKSGQPKDENQSKQNQKNQDQGKQSNSPQGQKGQQNSQTPQAGSQSQQSGRKDQSLQPRPEPRQDAGKPEQNHAGPRQSPAPERQKNQDTKGGQSQKPPLQEPESSRREPGQMTKDEAKQLLDSLKGDEHNLPPAEMGRGPAKPQENQPLKDW